LNKLLAPILTVTTEEVWQVMRRMGLVEEPSVHLTRWPQPPGSAEDEAFAARWATFLALREAVMKALEVQRGRQVIHSSLEAQVTLVVRDPSMRRLCESYRATLAETFVVSDVQVEGWTGLAPPPTTQQVVPGPLLVGGLVEVRVERALGAKCQRCWKYSAGVGAQPASPEVCERCAQAVSLYQRLRSQVS
jgi:isoleucyl-tRNA synthetase